MQMIKELVCVRRVRFILMTLGMSTATTVTYGLPESVDWRREGYVTPVKNQDLCLGSWAFAAAGAIEGQHFKATRKLVSLSAQQLIDCGRQQGNMGCNGGTPNGAFAFVQDNKGIAAEDSYGYSGVDQECNVETKNIGVKVAGFVRIKSRDENALAEAVSKVGPVAAMIDGSHESFKNYYSGVYHEPLCSQTRLDTSVLIVGYGSTEKKEKYWIVKASKGTSWGAQGYILMSRDRKNNCGIATDASYPILD